MEKKPKPEMTKTKPINIMLPEELVDRVNIVCADKDVTIQEFVVDAIIEKLELTYKDRRKRPRL
ncbi:MAG: hypothetical protein PVG86_07245 [Desulfobacterales bacterium]|jgi:hypothetical protein